MLIEQTVDKLNALKLGAMADAFQKQLDTDQAAALSFEERLGLLVDTEWTAREQRKLDRRLRTAKLRYPATLEAVDFTHSRRLNRQQILTLGACAWIAERHNVIVTGPCGIGKSFLACAFVERACRRSFAARYVRMPRLLHELAVGRGDGSYTRLLARLAKLDLLAIDDWMLAPLRDPERRDLIEVIEDRAERASTLIASQLPVTDWHAVIGDPNQADAICDRPAPRRAPHRAQGPLDATDARRTRQPPEGDDMTITSARRPTLPPGANSLWILAVPWKTRAIRSAATAPSPKARFPQHLGRRTRRPQEPQATSSMLTDTTARVGYRPDATTPMGGN